jgi:hypothetical protein
MNPLESNRLFFLDLLSLRKQKYMAHATGVNLNSSIQLTELLEFGRDYCSDQFGRFFQSKYSPLATPANKFQVPAKLAKNNMDNSFAICVLMNNHIMDLKYFRDIFLEWDEEIDKEVFSTGGNFDEINTFINDQRLQNIITRFKKINDEIVIGQCRGNEFTPFS